MSWNFFFQLTREVVLARSRGMIWRQDARRWGKEGSVEIKHFFQRLSVALQRGNAALLIDRDIEPHV